MMQPFTGDTKEWNRLISNLPGAHLLQTSEWAQVKAAYGWESMPFIWRDRGKYVAAAMLLKKSVGPSCFPWRPGILYSPKGPLVDWSAPDIYGKVLDDMQEFCLRQGSIFLKCDPDVILTHDFDEDDSELDQKGESVQNELIQRGWKYSSSQIQFRNTVLLDISQSEEEILARMKQKTRYNLRLAQKKGVTVRLGNSDDLPVLYRMYAETSLRDGFVIRNEEYYHAVWSAFMHTDEDTLTPHAEPLIAQVDGEPVAALFIFYFSGKGYYLYGMSREAHRDKMPNYLLQWEAICRAKAAGCSAYDLWGAPDELSESDPMWGVYRFKEGLGGRLIRTLGAWDYAPNRLWYKLYTDVMPEVLNVMRRRGKRSTQLQIDS